MRNFIAIVFLFCFSIVTGQSKNTIQENKKKYSFNTDVKIEDENGHLITDSLKRIAYFDKKQEYIDSRTKNNNQNKLLQTAVPLCYNGSFEEFTSTGGTNLLNYFQYAEADPLNPIQCQSFSLTATNSIKQYDPNDSGLMASTVPSNYLDEFIGNINGFDQYVLKIKYKHLDLSALSIVQAKRFKTNNETSIKFNYKAVLQSISESGHDNEQPYFKARVLNSFGQVVSEFCLIGDPLNCIFLQAPNLEEGSVILYTPNWQSGILDISTIPNNQEFTVEFMASRCGLGGHFGYAYVDDICLLHSTENLQGSIELDPLNKVCPTSPISVCGSFTIPNSSTISASVTSIILNVYNENNTVVYTTQTPISLDLINLRFCFEILASNLPNITTGTYNVGVTINYGIVQTNCTGTIFNSESDNDANPGWDIWYLNCTNCDITPQTAALTSCDSNHDGKEFFNLSNANSLVVTATAGLTFSYFNSLIDATNNTNPILNFLNFESYTSTIFIRITLNATCYKIIPISLIVKNPSAYITGILNVCTGSTVLNASPGASYLWYNGATTQSITVNAVGTYSVTVTDTFGCQSIGSVTILSNSVAPLPTIAVTQPTCSLNTGTITVTSPASEYSYDNGVTWVTNPSITNLAVGSYSVKIRTASGCTSYNTTINIVPFLSSFPSFTSISPTFCGGLGSITITTVSSEYSFDDGITWTTNNTQNNLPSGTYNIRVKDAAGCISNYNSVVINGEFLDPPLFIKNDPYCGNLGSITITTPALEYSFDGGTTWQTSNTLSNLTDGSYIVKIKNAQGCTSPNVYVYLYNLESSYPQYTLINAGCGTYATVTITTLGDSYSFDGGTTWTTNPVMPNLNNGDVVSIIVRKGLSCNSYTANVYIYSSYYPIPLATDYQTTLCDDLNDGSENVDLSLYNTNLIANSSQYNFTYFTSLNGAETNNFSNQILNFNSCNLSNSNNTVYVRVRSSDGCYKVAELKFTFIDSPVIVMENSYILCEFRKVLIDAGPGFDSYLWSTGETTQTIFITEVGNYSVTVTENHSNGLICNSTKTFTIILSNPATFTSIETVDWTDFDNSITVYVSGVGIYEYSIDGIHYQDSNVFSNLESGSYTVYVRDKNECGIVEQEVFLLMYPRYFTPNNDGFHDTWNVRFAINEPGIKVEIYDRFGKFLKNLTYNTNWDGTYNTILLPSTDYWFVVTRANGKIYKGHFALKR